MTVPTHPAWGENRDNKLKFSFSTADIFPQRNTTMLFSPYGLKNVELNLVKFPIHSVFVLDEYDVATRHGLSIDADNGAIKYTPEHNRVATMAPRDFGVTVTTYQHLSGSGGDVLVGTHKGTVRVEIVGTAPPPPPSSSPGTKPPDPVTTQPATNADPTVRLYAGQLRPDEPAAGGAQQINLTAKQAAAFKAAYAAPLLAHVDDAYPTAKIVAGQPAADSGTAFGRRIGAVRYSTGEVPGAFTVDYHTGLVTYNGDGETRTKDETKTYQIAYSAVYSAGADRFYTVYSEATLQVTLFATKKQPVAAAKPAGATFTHTKAGQGLAWYYYLLIAIGAALLAGLAVWAYRRNRRGAS